MVSQAQEPPWLLVWQGRAWMNSGTHSDFWTQDQAKTRAVTGQGMLDMGGERAYAMTHEGVGLGLAPPNWYLH